MTDPQHSAPESFRLAIRDAARGLVDRESLVELVALAAVAGEHLLVIGPPGTAKSEAVRRIARAIGGQYFEYLLGRFTEPSEIFGPVDLRKLREGTVETETRGMLPEAHLAFLDKIFLGSTAILNTLLGVLNERTFYRGHTRIACPLRVCVAASNALPSDESLAALADRFLVRVFVDPVPDGRLEELLERGSDPWAPSRATSVDDLDRLSQAARKVELEGVRPELAEAIRRLRREGVVLSDRRLVKLQRLVAAAAAIDGRDRATSRDLWPIVYAVPTAEEQAIAREALGPLLSHSASDVLVSASASASEGLAARAAKLAAAIEEALREAPVEEQAAARHRLRLEGLARALDAAFAPDSLPETLATQRNALVAAIGGAP